MKASSESHTLLVIQVLAMEIIDIVLENQARHVVLYVLWQLCAKGLRHLIQRNVVLTQE